MWSIVHTPDFIEAFDPIRVNVACYLHEGCKQVDYKNNHCPTPRSPFCPSSDMLGELWGPVAQAYLERRIDACR